MGKQLPGATIEVGSLTPDIAETLMMHIFSGGGVMLSQVCTMTGLEAYMVQNWVKRGFLTKPHGKTYDPDQLARIFFINMLRDVMQIDEIVSLLSYINGALDDRSDDLIADSILYNLFVNLLCETGEDMSHARIHAAVGKVVPENLDPTTRRYIGEVLTIMAYAYYSAQFRADARRVMCTLDR